MVSRAMTTTASGAAAVDVPDAGAAALARGLKMRVFVSSKLLGVDEDAWSSSRHVAGEVAGLCETDARVLIATDWRPSDAR